MVEADAELPLLLVGSERWHKGVIGLVASRLVERFHRPTCVIAWEEGGEGTGSLRSIAGVDIGHAVRTMVAEGLLVKGGGHAMAAGLTVERLRLDALTLRMQALLAEPAAAAREAHALDFDGALTAASVTDELLDLIERAGPYGQESPQPRFALPAHRVKFAKVMGEAHIRCVLEAGDGTRLDAMAFRSVGQPVGELLLSTGGMPIHVAGTLRRDTWGGRQRLELTIEDVADPRRQTG
jgi:single-stranded-DNA-specific exonuclease